MDDTVVTSIVSLKYDGEKKPYVTFVWGSRMGELIPIEKEETIVGRSNDCDLWIEDKSISRRHFSIELVDNGFVLKDLGSTNGTLINGNKVNEAVLKDGDKIQISKDTILEFNFLDETKRLSEKKIYEMGVMDPVTNTYNKRYFLNRVAEEFSFSKRKGVSLSLMIFDIDFFKKLNDTYGHLAGDVALQKIGYLVTNAIRKDDIFARYGGEEFVILMRDTPVQNAVNLAERLRKIIDQNEFAYEGNNLPVTISVGVAAVTEKHKDHLDLISEADQFLYQAKAGGRNRVRGPCAPI